MKKKVPSPMQSWTLEPELVFKLQSLQLRAERIVDGFITGQHHSPLHGSSIEFAEHRPYSPGDDLRYLDWKVYGKTDRFYVRRFEDETNLACYAVLDSSESMAYAGPKAVASKWEYGKTLAAALCYLALRQRDAAGLVLFDSEVREFVRASNSPSQLGHVMAILDQAQAEQQSQIGNGLDLLAERIPQRSILFIFSDFLEDVESTMAGLKHLKHFRHDVRLVHLIDRAEIEFPFRRSIRFRGLEGKPSVVTDPRALRKAYLEQMNAFLKRIKQHCMSYRIRYELVVSDEPFDRAMSRILIGNGGQVSATGTFRE